MSWCWGNFDWSGSRNNTHSCIRVNIGALADLSLFWICLGELQDWFVFLCVYKYVFLCSFMCVIVHLWGGQRCPMQLLYTLFVCICTYTCMCVECMCTWKPEVKLNCSPFYFLKHDLSLAWGSQIQLDWLASESLDSACLTPLLGSQQEPSYSEVQGRNSSLYACTESTLLFQLSSQSYLLYFTILSCLVPSS